MSEIFEVPESKAKTADGQVKFRIPGSKKVFVFPKFQYMPTEAAAAAAKFEAGDFDLETMRDILATMFGSVEAADLAVKLDGEQLQWMLDKWSEASDVSVGESEPSGG